MNLKNKRIVLIIKSPVLGGAERQALGFAKYAINSLNCNVTIVATHSDMMSNEFKSFANSSGITKILYFGEYVIKLDKTLSFNNLKKLVKTSRYLFKVTYGLRKIKPDLIVPFLNSPSKLAVLIYNFTGAKYTFWHQLGLDHFAMDYLEKLAIRKTPLFIANAENGIKEITSSYKVNKNKLYVLPQYTSLEYIKHDVNDLKVSLKIKREAIIIGMISHYRKEKLFNLLLESFVNISDKYNIHLVFLGDASSTELTKEKYSFFVDKVENLDCKNQISILTGLDVSKVLSLLDIGVLVSTIEGTPNVVMEYMMYGLPIISTNHIGCEKLLNSDELLINNNKEELTDRLEYLLTNQEKRRAIGILNKQRVRKYSEENYFKKLTEILKNINK